MINKKTVQLSVVLNERVYDDVKKLAIKKRTSMGNIIRSFIIKGLTVESHDENKEDFRRMIHDEMTEVFKQEVERLIKLQVKSTKASAITMYTGLQIMSESFADDVSFARVVASASKQAAAYMKQERMFYDNPDFVNATHTTMQALTKIALIDEWENELHNDLPSFIKSAFAWDELIGYGSIDDEIQYEETPVKVVRDFFLKEKGTMYSYEGEYTDCIWNLEERDGKPVINIAVKRENESKPVFSFDKTFEWNDITNAVIARIQQEKIYNKLVEHCYKFSKYHTDDYRVYDPEEGRTVIRGSAKQIKECFGKLLNKQEVKMLIETEIVPTLAKADEQFEVDCENDDMEI